MSKGKYKLARERLFTMRSLKNSIDNLTDMILEINDKLDGYKPLNMEGMPTGGNKPNYFREKLIDEKIVYENKLKGVKEDLYLLMLPLKTLENELSLLLEWYYVGDESVDSICQKMNLSVSAFQRRKDKALEHLENILAIIM